MSRRARGRTLRILVTAGSTREKIDPVRFLSNYSTGTMGYEIAAAAAGRGHEVVLVSGPVCLERPLGVRRVMVESGREMAAAVARRFTWCDALCMAAAVCDWRPAAEAPRKLKKDALRGRPRIDLVENPDILREAGRRKGAKVLVGFALETEAAFKNAAKKCARKNLDFIVANTLTRRQGVFGKGAFDYEVLARDGGVSKYKGYTKRALARALIDKVEALCYSNFLTA